MVIQLRENQKVSEVRVNLQTMVMLHEGKRVWDKDLLGTYYAINQLFGKAKLRIKAFLKTPTDVFQDIYPPLQIAT